jgi:ribosomal protein L37AE/L43A
MTPQCAGLPEIPAGRRSSHTPRPTPGARPVPCPYCGTTAAVRQTSDTGRIQAWSCDRCATDFAFTVADSPTAALLGDLGAVAQEIRRLRWALAQLITLADEMPKLTDVEFAYPVADANRVGCPVTRPARWATSPLDADVHLRGRSAQSQCSCPETLWPINQYRWLGV